MSNTNRVFWIDLVKGIAIILVVVGHILQMRLQPLLTGLYEFIFNFHMPLFLFMSGYVLKSIIFKANMNYLLDKYKRLMIPCVVFGALNCLLRRENLIADFFLAGGNGYWYLFALSIYITMICLCVYVCRKFKVDEKKIVYYVIGVFLLYCILSRFIHADYLMQKALLFNRSFMSPFFLLGFLCSYFEWKRKHTVIAFCSVAVVCLFVFRLSYIYVITSISMIILIISICRGLNDRNLVLRRIGNYGKQTLSVYVLHWFAFGVFTKKMFFPLANAEKSVATYSGGGNSGDFNILYYHRGMYICRE